MNNKNRIEIGYDMHCYSSSQIDEIAKVLSEEFEVEEHLIVQKSLAGHPLIKLIIFGPPSFFFAKGFFTTVGETLGKEVGADLLALYKKSKKAISKVIFDRSSNKTPILELTFKTENMPEISIFIRPKSQSILFKGLDSIKETHEAILNYINNESYKNVKRVALTLDETGENIEEFYVIDENNEIFHLEK